MQWTCWGIYSSGKEKGNRGKGHLALEMDLEPGMGRSRADLWLYNPRISGRDGIAALGMRDRWSWIESIGEMQIPYISNLSVHNIDGGRWEVRGHGFQYFSMVLHMRIRPLALLLSRRRVHIHKVHPEHCWPRRGRSSEKGRGPLQHTVITLPASPSLPPQHQRHCQETESRRETKKPPAVENG